MADRATELAIPSIREAFEAFLALSPQEFGILVGIALWAGLLAMPLTRIDRRDRVTQATYAAFMTFAGTALILARNKYLSRAADAGMAIAAMTAFAGVAALRWLVDRAKHKRKTV